MEQSETMGLQEWIDNADTNCARGRTLLGFGSDVWTRDLSREESQILVSSAQSGDVELAAIDAALYPSLNSGGAAIFAARSDFERSTQWDAFVSLCLRGVIEPTGGGKYRVAEVARRKGRQSAAQRMFGEACPN